MKKSTKIALFAVCVFSSFLQGWITLKVYAVGVWLLYFGIVGAIPFLLLNGVHGDAEGAAGVVGGILYVLTNGAVYYWIVSLFLKLWRWRQERACLKSADLSAIK
jgi:hypothetical protein